MSTAEKIKKLRKKIGCSQDAFAKMVDIKYRATISDYENGINRPSIKTANLITILAKKYGVELTLKDLLM